MLEIFPSWSDLGVEINTATQNTWDAELGRASKYWYYYSGFIFKEKVQDTEPGDELPLMYPVGVNMVKMLCLAHADAAFGDYSGLPFTFEPRSDDQVDEVDRQAARFARSILLDSNAPTMFWEMELERQLYGGTAFKISADPTKTSGVRWQRIPKGTFYPIWDPTDPDELLEAYVITWLTDEQAKVKFNYTKSGTQEFIARVEHWTRSTFEVTIEGNKVKGESGHHTWGIVPFVYVPRYRLDNWWGEAISEDLMQVQNEINMRLGDIGEAINYNSHPIIWGMNLPMQFDQKNYPIGSSTMWDIGRTIGNSPEPKVGVMEIKNPVPNGAFEFVRFLYDWGRTSTFAPPIAFGEDSGGGQRSGVTLEIRLWPLLKAVQRSRSYLYVALRKAMMITSRILEQKNYSSLDKGIVKRLSSGILEPKFHNVMPRDHNADVDEVVKLLNTPMPAISMETVQEVLGRGSPEVSRILAMLNDPKMAKYFEKIMAPQEANTDEGDLSDR